MSTEPDQITETQEGKNKRLTGELTIPFPEDFIYSNASALGTSLMDIHISFAEVLPSGTVKPKVGVVIPLEQAVQLVMGLLDQITLYERSFGEIRNPQWRVFSAQAKANAEAMGQIRRDALTPEVPPTTAEPPQE